MSYTPWLQGHHVGLTEMLDGREYRAYCQQSLLNKWKESRVDRFTLVCFTLNVAGPIKVFALAEEAFAEGCRCIEEGSKGSILQQEILYRPYGHEAYFVVDEDCIEIKKILTEIEESHPLGRLFDIDVLREDGSKVSRQEIGYPPRKCLLCDEMASDCARSRTHTVTELQQKTVEMMITFIKGNGISPEMTGRICRMALLHEVYTTPKPGLVDMSNNGSHKDMDVALFEKSAAAIEGYFKKCQEAGSRNGKLPVDKFLSVLRPLGIQAEKDMFEATAGVNTHKGMVFSLGIICGAIGWITANNKPLTPDNLLKTAGEIAYPALDSDLKGLEGSSDLRPLTAGERQYAAYGISGIRGEAAGGFQSVVKYGMPYFRECLAEGRSFEEAGSLTLLNLIANVTDTNMIARSDVETQRKLQEEIRQLLVSKHKPDRAAIESLDEKFIDLNVSPGGCADLLAIIYFLWLWEQIV